MTSKIHKLLKKGRFVLLEKGKKNPIEEAWVVTPEFYERGEGGSWINKKTKEPYRNKDEEIYRRELHSYNYDDPKLIKHIEDGGNIGYLCGSNGMYVIDIDTEGFLEVFEKLLGKETLTFKTARGYHLYVHSEDELFKLELKKDGEKIGEFLGIGQQAVVWGSKNEKEGKEYELLKDLPIVELTNEKLMLLKEKFTQSKIFEVKEPNWSQYKDVSGLDILSIFTDTSKMKKHGNQIYGSHPIHGSTGGMNFWIHPNKNFWHCFRCSSGGDALSLLAVLEGICECSDFKKGGKRLKGEDFKKTLKILEEKYNLKLDSKKSKDELNKLSQNNFFEIKIISAKELSEMDLPSPSWIIKDILPEEGIVVLAGKTASMKSFLATVMAICCVNGLPFLSKFETKKGGWLYIDEENPLKLTKDRTGKIVRGLNVDFPENLNYICHSGIKIDKEEHMSILEDIIKEYKPSVVVLDSLVRFLSSADENVAGEMSNVFYRLRRLSNLHNVVFLVIHHLRKGKDNGSDRDEKVRGSTDIVNAVDVLVLVSRKDKTSPYINVQQEKNRYDKEMDPFVVYLGYDHSKDAMLFNVSSESAQEQDIESTASDDILEWLRNEKVWGDKKNMIFKTKEAIDKFDKIFHKNDDRNRKIISGALGKLVTSGKLIRAGKGYYQFLGELNLDDPNK